MSWLPNNSNLDKKIFKDKLKEYDEKTEAVYHDIVSVLANHDVPLDMAFIILAGMADAVQMWLIVNNEGNDIPEM